MHSEKNCIQSRIIIILNFCTIVLYYNNDFTHIACALIDSLTAAAQLYMELCRGTVVTNPSYSDNTVGMLLMLIKAATQHAPMIGKKIVQCCCSSQLQGFYVHSTF